MRGALCERDLIAHVGFAGGYSPKPDCNTYGQTETKVSHSQLIGKVIQEEVKLFFVYKTLPYYGFVTDILFLVHCIPCLSSEYE